jgi:parvulin-like peptidyl-prolyl isomerase
MFNLNVKKSLKVFSTSLILAGSLFLSANAQNIASVNGEVISDLDLLPIIGTLSQGRYAQLDPQTQQRINAVALEQAIAQILIEKEAKKSGLLRSKSYKQQLEIAIKHLKRQLVADTWLKSEFDKVKISHRELKKYYNENKKEFVQPEQFHARHILVEDEATAKQLIRILKRKRGEALKEKFIDIAKSSSKGPSGKNGGDLGYFGKGMMVPEFEQATSHLSVGSITLTPVHTKFGYHIIYLEDKKSQRTAKFDEVSHLIEQKVKLNQFQGFVQKKIQKLKSKANIKKY